MVLKDAQGNTYVAHFSYEYEKSSRDAYLRPMQTLCKVHSGPCTRELDAMRQLVCVTPSNMSVALCNPKDHFEKAMGRKLALTRALKPLPKQLRKELRASYFQQVKH